ncbi:MAG: hypothetical protein MK135_03085 [Polyangiaceae bacterium]|nr:hypothetical protein [Polyangiaceae bacterium]
MQDEFVEILVAQESSSSQPKHRLLPVWYDGLARLGLQNMIGAIMLKNTSVGFGQRFGTQLLFLAAALSLPACGGSEGSSQGAQEESASMSLGGSGSAADRSDAEREEGQDNEDNEARLGQKPPGPPNDDDESDCAEGSYKDGETCRPWTICQSWQTESQPGTKTSNRECVTNPGCPDSSKGCPITPPEIAFDQHTVFAIFEGQVYSWGRSYQGNMGSNLKDSVESPLKVELSQDKQVASVEGECAVFADGTAECWDHSSRVPIEFFTGESRSTSLRQLAWGYGELFGLTEDGKVYRRLNSDDTPTEVLKNESSLSAEAIAGSREAFCVIESGGKVSCLGESSLLGADQTEDSDVLVPIPELDGSAANRRATGIDLGRDRACVTVVSGEVLCWGSDSSGMLGNGDTLSGTKAPTPVEGLPDDTAAVALGLGEIGYHSCAVLQDGTAWCWGQNQYGELGNGRLESSQQATQVLGLDGSVEQRSAVQISGDRNATCALTATGGYACWGTNRYGATGIKDAPLRKRPPEEVVLDGAVAEVAGDTKRLCARLESGKVQCWGPSASTTDGSDGPKPVLVPGLTGGSPNNTAVKLSALADCSVLQDGSVTCWEDGSLDRFSISAVTLDGTSDATSAVALSSGSQSSGNCAALKTGRLVCWGNSNSSGLLGNGTTTSSDTPFYPAEFTGADDSTSVVDVQVRPFFACALSAAGSVYCWGTRSGGFIGVSSSDSPLVPTLVPSWNAADDASTVTKMTTSYYEVCVNLKNGEVACRSNTGGLFSPVFNDTTSMPVQTVHGDRASSRYRCTLLDDGTVRCSGQDDFGQFGRPSGSTEPEVSPLPAVDELYPYGATICATTSAGALYCWGNNENGLLAPPPWYTEAQLGIFP